MINNELAVGDRFKSMDGKTFVILHILDDLEGHSWIHYRNDDTGTEYSCWRESFLARFTKDCQHRYV